MSKYFKADDVLAIFSEEERPLNWTDSESEIQAENDFDFYKSQIESLPTIEVCEDAIGQGSGDIDWQAVTSTGQEIYAKGYEDGRKSVEVSKDCISRADLIKSFLDDNECDREEAKACMCSLDLMLELIENAPSVTTEQSSVVGEMTNLDYIRTLSAEELYQVLFVEVRDMSMSSTNSRLFIIDWLKEERIEE